MITSDTLSNAEFSYELLENAEIMRYVRTHLPNHGILRKDNNSGYHYLKVHDDYIFKLFPHIKDKDMKIPDYFPITTQAGAHITVFYADEITQNNKVSLTDIHEINSSYTFEVNQIISVKVFNRKFIALVVEAPALLALRRQYGLPDKLHYRGLMVPFHITIAVSS